MSVIEVEADTLCVLFDGATGAIAYTHRVVTLVGGERRDPASVEATTRQLAAERGRDVSALDALHLPGDAMDELGVFKVNVVSRELSFQTFKEAGIDIGVDISVGGGIDLGPLGL